MKTGQRTAAALAAGRATRSMRRTWRPFRFTATPARPWGSNRGEGTANADRTQPGAHG